MPYITVWKRCAVVEILAYATISVCKELDRYTEIPSVTSGRGFQKQYLIGYAGYSMRSDGNSAVTYIVGQVLMSST